MLLQAYFFKFIFNFILLKMFIHLFSPILKVEQQKKREIKGERKRENESFHLLFHSLRVSNSQDYWNVSLAFLQIDSNYLFCNGFEKDGSFNNQGHGF